MDEILKEEPIKEVINKSFMGDFKVYVHINKINDKKYVGITKQNIKYRWRSDGSGYFRSPFFYKAIQKYGWENFEHIVLYDNIDEKTAKLLEQHYIKYYKTKDRRYGYNMTDGGDGTWGVFVSEETRKKLSIAGKGKKRSAETRLRQSIARLGKKPTPETLIKLSESHKGNKLSPHAKQIALQTLKINCEKRKKKICGINENGGKIEFNSIIDASNALNCPIMNKRFKQIVQQGKIIGGYKWNYKEECYG